MDNLVNLWTKGLHEGEWHLAELQIPLDAAQSILNAVLPTGYFEALYIQPMGEKPPYCL